MSGNYKIAGPDIHVRGVRGPIPSNYLIGRASQGTGPAELISMQQMGQMLQQSGQTVAYLSKLRDVSLTTLSDKQRLRYSASAGKWVNIDDTLANLKDVDTTGLLTNQLLRFNGTLWAPWTLTYTLAGASDVLIASPADKQALVYVAAASKWENVTLNFSYNSDVLITSPADGQYLQYNAASGKWKNVSVVATSSVLSMTLSANQTGNTPNTWVKINLNSVTLDTLSAWDNTNHKYIPPAGLYLFICTVQTDGNSGQFVGAAVYKNGVAVEKNLLLFAGATQAIIQVCATVDVNGTDYIEAFGFGSVAAGTVTFYIPSPSTIPILTAVRLGASGGGGGGSSTLAGDTDVVISIPANGQVLTYNSATSKWVNSAVGTPAIGSHRYWGLMNITPYAASNSNPCIAEIELHATVGGAAVSLASATATATSQFDGTHTPAQAIDANAATFWDALNTFNQDFMLDLGVGNTTPVAEIKITTRNDAFFAQGAAIFDVCYSDDNVIWVPVSHVHGPVFTVAGQAQTFKVRL